MSQFQRRSDVFSNDGFVIIFLVILFVGVFCVIQSRGRAFRQLRRGDDGDSADELHTKPMLWEPWVSSGGYFKWNSIMPLSLSVLRQEPEPSESLPAAPTPRRILPRKAEAIYHRRSVSLTNPSKLQVAVIIAMPYLDHDGGGQETKLADYSIGVSSLPWDKEI